MTFMASDIIFMRPAFTCQPWGGTKLRDVYGYDVQGDVVGECWGISAHETAESVVCGGVYDGMNLSVLWDTHRELFGGIPGDRFPLLVKIIDARQDLSVQVHPDDDYAVLHEEGASGKTECWYILDCPENATLIFGHNARTKDELRSMIDEGRWSDLIREIPVQKGDFIQMDPGTVHSIRGGITLLETQQNSDITYRVYDFDRLFDGKKRPLHIKQSIDVITLPSKSADGSVLRAPHASPGELCELISCGCYRVFKMSVCGPVSFHQDYPFVCVSVIEGEGRVNGREIKKGDHFIIPSCCKNVLFDGKMEMIMSTVGENGG